MRREEGGGKLVRCRIGRLAFVDRFATTAWRFWVRMAFGELDWSWRMGGHTIPYRIISCIWLRCELSSKNQYALSTVSFFAF